MFPDVSKCVLPAQVTPARWKMQHSVATQAMDMLAGEISTALPSLMLRISNAVAYVVLIAINVASSLGALGPTNAELSRRHPTPLTPAGWVPDCLAGPSSNTHRYPVQRQPCPHHTCQMPESCASPQGSAPMHAGGRSASGASSSRCRAWASCTSSCRRAIPPTAGSSAL